MSKYPPFLMWLDSETTGLDPATDRLLEVGLMLTDKNLQVLAGRSVVIRQPRPILASMSDWCQKTHQRTGLTTQSLASPFAEEEAQAQLLNFARNWFTLKAGTVPMAGASVHFDRAFLRRWMPQLHDWFYYGNLDVSSVEKAAHLFCPDLPTWQDKEAHRVDPDNLDAIAELAYYRDNAFAPGVLFEKAS